MSVAPPKKKQRKDKGEDVEDADAKLAALLQAQENQRTRATRGGGKPKAPVKKKKKATPRKKSDKKVGPDDDSDVEGSEGSGSRRRKAIGGFQKPFNLSYPLAELCGEAQVSTSILRCCITWLIKYLTCAAVATASRQETVGTHQRQPATRSQ